MESITLDASKVVAVVHSLLEMPTAEEKFRALLSRVGVHPSHATISQTFRQDAAHAEILPWIVENITDAHILDPQLRQEYEKLEGRLSLPLDHVGLAEGSEERLSLSEEDGDELMQLEEELQQRVEERDREIASLTEIAEQLEEELKTTEEKLKYAYQEDDVFVSALVRQSEQQGVKSCSQLETQYSAFHSVVDEFAEFLKTNGTMMHFTQSQPERYWNPSEELTRQLERMMKDVVASSRSKSRTASRLEDLLRLSDLSRCPWFSELERLRQYKQISDMRRVEMLLAKGKNEVRCRFIQQSAADFDRTADVASGLNGSHLTIEDVRAENKRLMLKKQALLTKKLPSLFAQLNRSVGMDLVREYIGRMCSEWNTMLIQKQEFLQHVCRQLDRNRVFTILGELERQRLDEMVRYVQNLDQTFRAAVEISKHRRELYVPVPTSTVDYIRPEDTFLHCLAAHVKLCGDGLEESRAVERMESSIASEGGMNKRQYSTAFSDTPVPGSTSGLSPISKLIKEQQQSKAAHSTETGSRATTPAELETSLRRLSVEEDLFSKTELFHDTPTQNRAMASVPFHEVTVQMNRLLALPSTSHLRVTQMFPDAFLPNVTSAMDALRELHDCVFQPSADQMVLSSPNLRSALKGVDHLIHDLNQISGQLKGEFKSFLAYLDRHPEEAKARQHLAQFFTS